MYCKGSGSKLNVDKSKGLWLGNWRSRKDCPGSFKIVKELKILGIIFGTDITPEDNWGPRSNKISSTLDKWSKRHLNLNGKVVIVNNLIGAGINYLGSVLECPNYWIKKMNDLIWTFFWSGKMEKIKRNTIIGPPKLGGMGLLNIESKLMSLKLQWLVRYPSSEGKWKLYFDYWLKCAGADDHLEWYIFANIRKNLQITPFYHELIVAFKYAGGKLLCNFTSIWEAMEVPLWNNVKVTRDESLLKSPLLKSVGCYNVGDVVRQGELFSFHDIARACQIRHINAGRILKDRQCIQVTGLPFVIIKAKLFLFVKLFVKSNYMNCIMCKFVSPKVQVKWKHIFHLGQDLPWASVWMSNWKNGLMDPDDKQFMYKLRHRILPTKDVLLKIGVVKELTCPLCNTNNETHEHIFIYCTHTWEAWIFVERLLRKYTGNKHYYLNDSNRILGYNLEPVQAIVVAKLLRLIWNIRCKKVFNGYSRPAEIDIISQLKKSLKYFLRMEKTRLSPESFETIYTRNNALCFTVNDDVNFDY